MLLALLKNVVTHFLDNKILNKYNIENVPNYLDNWASILLEVIT